jgi:NDMA-dependent alcohol dehydrogenase
MRMKAAVLWQVGDDWSVEDVELADPRQFEVVVRIAASGLCHSDDHAVTGDLPVSLPMVGGHEGAGVIEAIGPGVTTVVQGDHVVLSFIPMCGKCRWCTVGRANLCDYGEFLMTGAQISDGTYRVRARDTDVGTLSLLGTFAPYAVVHETSLIKINPDVPLEVAALVGCGVTTGWGSAVNTAGVRVGETVVIVGTGGVGINAVQGAAFAGAGQLIAVDPVEFKRKSALDFGATHACASIDEARELVSELTRGVMADAAVLTVDVGSSELVGDVLSLVSKGGRAVLTSVTPATVNTASFNVLEFTMFEKQLRGNVFGSANPRITVPQLLALYKAGKVKLEELITTRYSLDEINDGYRDMKAGKNLRGLVVHQH